MLDHLDATSLPATSYQVALYVTHLSRTGLRATTIRSHLSAVGFFHQLRGYNNPTCSFLIKKLLLGHKKRDGPILVRKPITLDVLEQIIISLGSSSLRKYERRLFTSLFSLMYHAALRASEVCISPLAAHTLQNSQIRVTSSNAGGVLRVMFKSYKHSPQQPIPLLLYPSSGVACPLRAFKSYINRRGDINGPAFVTSDGKPLTRQQVTNTLRTLLRGLGYNPSHYNTHSFRIGKATDMAKDGFSHAQIALLGRWKSNAFLKYIKPTVIHGTK